MQIVRCRRCSTQAFRLSVGGTREIRLFFCSLCSLSTRQSMTCGALEYLRCSTTSGRPQGLGKGPSQAARSLSVFFICEMSERFFSCQEMRTQWGAELSTRHPQAHVDTQHSRGRVGVREGGGLESSMAPPLGERGGSFYHTTTHCNCSLPNLLTHTCMHVNTFFPGLLDAVTTVAKALEGTHPCM